MHAQHFAVKSAVCCMSSTVRPTITGRPRTALACSGMNLHCCCLATSPMAACVRSRRASACAWSRAVQVFGKTMVCKDLEVATEVSRSSDLNCVTMDGDQRDKKGTLTGGFIDSSRSRLAAMRAIKVPLRESPKALQETPRPRRWQGCLDKALAAVNQKLCT